MNYTEQFKSLSVEDATKLVHEVLNARALDALDSMKNESTVNEMMGYIKHGGETIATNGSFFKVGTKRKQDGTFDPDEAAHFDNEDDAKSFIDGGKKGAYRSVSSMKSVKKSINPPTKLQSHERDELHKKIGLKLEETQKSQVDKLHTNDQEGTE